MSRWLRVAVPLGIAAVLVSVLAIGFGSPSSLAAPGGNGNGNGNGNHDAVLTVEPVASVAAGEADDVSVSGSGFRRNKSVLLYITGSMPVLHAVDGDGTFSFVQTLEGSGPFHFTAFQYRGNSWHKVAETTYPSQ